jgi:hypothetical protein
MAFTIEPDEAAKNVAPGGAPPEEATVTFRGWLGEETGGIHRLFTSPWFDEWLEIKKEHILFQLVGDEFSTVWVTREAHINKCQSAEACHFAEQELADDTGDPASAYPTAVRRKYPY